jgi:methionyl-tRNA formyltransferase
MRVLFYGTPTFAVPTLDAILRGHDVRAVVTQPDRPAHRGQRLTASPVKLRAQRAGVPVVQPPRLRDPEWPERLRAFDAEVAVVIAFGQILPRAVLDVPSRGSINVHASLLPKYRGAAPIAWAILRGETETGITTIQMDEGMDTGPILLAVATPIRPAETAGDVAERLAVLGADVLLKTLADLDRIVPTPQPHQDATLAPRLQKSDGHLCWTRPATELINVIRACNPWPGALTHTPAGTLLIWRATAVPGATGAAPGILVQSSGGLAIAAGDGAVLPVEVQPGSRRIVSWPEYLRGARLDTGVVFTSP